MDQDQDREQEAIQTLSEGSSVMADGTPAMEDLLQTRRAEGRRGP